MTTTVHKNEGARIPLCAVNVAREWLGDRREIVGNAPCGHPESRHDGGMCLDCDDEGNTAGMLHVFSSVSTDETGWTRVVAAVSRFNTSGRGEKYDMTPLDSPGLPDYMFVQGTGEAILNDEEGWPQILGKLGEPLASKVADRYNHYRTMLSALTTATGELLADHAFLRLTTACEADCRHCEIERHLEKVLAKAASIGYRVLDDYY